MLAALHGCWSSMTNTSLALRGMSSAVVARGCRQPAIIDQYFIERVLLDGLLTWCRIVTRWRNAANADFRTAASALDAKLVDAVIHCRLPFGECARTPGTARQP